MRSGLRRLAVESLALFVVLVGPAYALGYGEAWWKPLALAGFSALAWPLTVAATARAAD